MASKKKNAAPIVEEQKAPEQAVLTATATESRAKRGTSKVPMPVAHVWVLCYNMCSAAIAAGQPVPGRTALVNAAIADGITYYTARTQVQAFLKASANGTQRPVKLPRNVTLPEAAK